MSVIEACLDFLFPPCCPLCGREQESRGGWCEACLGRTLAVHRIALPKESSLDGAWAFSRYKSAVGALLRSLKYQGKRSCLPYVRTLLSAGAEKLPPEMLSADLAIPVPLHEKKESERGFNQAELIFRAWLSDCGIACENLLCRRKETPPLYGLSAKERTAVLRAAFSLREDAPKDAVREKRVLLLDDILTTGTTIEEAAKRLRSAGAKEIYALVVSSDHD